MARRHYMGKVEVLVDEARRRLRGAQIESATLDRYKELKARVDSSFSNLSKEEWDEYDDICFDIRDQLADRQSAQVFIEMAERLANEGGIAFVIDGKTFGDQDPKETYNGCWTPSDCYDEDGFINDLLDCYDEV